MIKDIVQSDIDLAKRLIEARRRDDEILLRLQRRGIDPAQAEALLDALHEGRPFAPAISATRSIPEAERVRFAASPGELAHDIPPPSLRNRNGRGGRVLFFSAALIAIVLGGWYYGYHVQTHSMLVKLEDLQRVAGSSQSTDARPAAQQAATLAKEIQQRRLNASELAMIKTIIERMAATQAQ